MSTVRALAAVIIDEVTDGHSLTARLEHHLPALSDPRDRALVQALCFGVCRSYTQLDAVLALLLARPLRARESVVQALLLVGLYQLRDMRMPAYAAVTETVNAVEDLKKPWARGLVNAVLRSHQRDQAKLADLLSEDEEARYAHPAWLIAEFRKAWPADWEAILQANNVHPPLALRVNVRWGTRAAYLDLLDKSGHAAEEVVGTTAGLRLLQPVPTDTLPQFAQGAVSVQDGAAQLAATLLPVQAGQRILDACAAPGGKLTHLLECHPTAQVIALDHEAARLATVHENLARLGLDATCVCADATDTAAWWDGQPFDHILLDTPCSGTGVLRRHPDIKLLRQPRDIPTLAHTQAQLLHALWPILKPGGCLLYATCSVLSAENSLLIEQFLQDEPEAALLPISLPVGRACPAGWQILPGEQDMDGFYYALLRKVKSDEA